MKVLIIGGVAAGTKAAAKIKRLDRSIEVQLITKGEDISYAGCGLPYYVGGTIESREQLIVNSPAKYAALTGAEVLTGREAVKLDAAGKMVTARNLRTGETETYSYDKLVIATGASPVVPPVEGTALEGVFTMRTPEDAVATRAWAQDNGVKKAVVVGGGFIGLELAENLHSMGIQVTVVDFAPQVLPNIFDSEMADYVRRHLNRKGIQIITGRGVEAILGEGRVSAVQAAGEALRADLVVLSVGIRPNTGFLQDTGLEMCKGTIVVNGSMQTNLPDIYAAGDCAMVTSRMTGKGQWSPMGSTANLSARVLAKDIAGQKASYPGVLGTGVVKLPELNCGRTGLTEAQAKEAGFDVVTALSVADDKAHYYPGASSFITKLIADRASRRLLGLQVLGAGAVDKMTDIAATAIAMKATLEDLESLDLAYAPPFSTAIHPFVLAVHVLQNKMDGVLESITPAEFQAGKAKGYRILDVSLAPSIRGAQYIELGKVNGPIEGIGKDEKLLLICQKGKRSYFLQSRLKHYGYTNTVTLEGGLTFSEVKVAVSAAVTPEEEKAVKALGFLRDKRTADCFNGRVITRNGKITAEESRAIAEAAELFGSGEVTMTSRLTLEIQGVPYDNIEPLRDYLRQRGLETGGTGSKVRPVVSCKGTTCQYGLIDTFALSEKIHERFFHGYSNVKLPHKFKIAVGGCPNNCVKPDLNDLGVIGQRVPNIQYDKCRGCKVCQIEKNCPIQVAKMTDSGISVDKDACNHCGRCLGKCPFGAFEEYTEGYRVYIGGRWGKKVARGRYLSPIFTSEEAVMAVIENAILLFREQGITGERFADTVERLGFENVEAQLLSDGLLSRKAENIAAEKHTVGGATC